MNVRAGVETIIGREHPSAVVHADIARLVESHGGLLLVTGEAGIGKTTLVSEAAEQARRRGVLVLGGSCWESARAPDYWPWVQVIRALRRATSAAEWADIDQAAGPALATLLGEALLPAGATSQGPPIWPELAERSEVAPDAFRLADAVTTALVVAAQARPVMVVLEDLHWADPASLHLLEFAGQHTWFERLLLAGTYRDTEVDATDGPVRSMLAPIVAKATSVTLTGLGRDDVAALISQVAGQTPPPAVVDEIYRRTGGNPFFVEQTARLWQVEGVLGAVPPGVRDAVRRRIALLPQPVADLLVAASVLGRDLDRALLAGIVGREPAAVDDILDVAMAARLVATAGPGRLAFTHDLVRETLYSGLNEAERQRRHAAVVTTITGAKSATPLLPADLARHAYRAGPHLSAELVVDLLTAAARDASSRLASREAVNHYRHALARAEDPTRRGRIALDLGRELEHSGQLEEARPYLDDAAATALAEDDPHLLARVALTAQRHPPTMAGSVAGPYDAASLLSEAHRRLVGDHGAAEATEAADPAEAADAKKEAMVRELVVHAEQLARRDADDEALLFILWLRHDTAWGLGTAAERLALITELRELAKRTGDRDTDIFGRSFTWVALLELGDPRYLDQSASFVSAAQRLDLPRYQISTVVDRGIIAGFRGNFAEAESDMEKFVHMAEHGSSEFAVMTHHLRWSLSLLRGHFDRIDLQLAALTTTDHPFLELAIAITAAERGDAQAALRHGMDIRARADTYPQYLEPLLLRVQAQVAAIIRDEAWAAEIRQALLPHQGEWLVSIYGCDISGPVEHWLALLAVSFGRWDEATHHAAAAVAAAERLGSRPWALKARVLLAEALSGAGDAVAASRVESEARREAQALDMMYVLGEQPATVPGDATETASATDSGEPEFRREGAVWRLRYDGLVVHMPDAKGLRDLHTLVSLPYQDIPAVRLLEPAGGAEIVAARRLGGDPVLDDEAKARYRSRLADLDGELDRADSRGDAQRATALERERDALLTELRRAAGLAGRSRRLGDESERARKAVTARIRDTLRKLDERHPALAEHLRRAVSTGSTCRYSPVEPTTWSL